MITINKNNVRKILIIKLRGIGDVVLSTIVLKNLKRDFPHSEISYLTEKHSAQVLKNLPQLRHVYYFEKLTLLQKVKFFLLIRYIKFDLILDFYSNPTTALLTFFSGAIYRAGFPYKGRKYAYNLYGPIERNKYHAAMLHLEFLKRIGLSANESELLFLLDKNANSFASNLLSNLIIDKKSLVGICPTGGWESKKCDPIKLAEIADNLINKYKINVIILWGPGDESDANEIKHLMKNNAYLAPKTTILEMAAIIAKCKFVICNDSGPMHISVALDVPVLALFGPTDPILQGPFGEKHEWVNLEELDCIKCNLLKCPKNHECFLNLPINKIMTKVDLLIKKNEIELD
ncbi:glycosyltransferase family 9 protein [Melioribacteraceae bacterium 4301-Me]|uniref:glycosyltransferase family 9 protein n=1 Tax=Pyranulibacter aquaticus TaxID=3163344 RepID=UPI003596CE96